MKVSIIVPTLNEELVLEKTLTQFQQLSPHELIVSDGGSDDDTRNIAGRFSHRVITGSAGRALQMNVGADEATGDILLFLHADSRIEPESYRKMLQCMQNPKWIGGTFTLYGDQGFFVRKEVFKDMNGFSPLPICEDLDFYHRLRKKGPVILLTEKAHTSPRRWIKEGILFTTARNTLIAVLFGLGFPPHILTKWYLAIR